MNGLPPSARDVLEPRGEQRIVGRRERQLVDDTTDSASPGTSTPSQKLCAAEQHRVAERAEARQQLGARTLALHQQRKVEAFALECASASDSRARASARSVVNSRNARPPLAFSTGSAASTTASVCSTLFGCGQIRAARTAAPASA